MLHYCKMILEKMTIDKQLFQKELKKAYKRLPPEEASELYIWSKNKYPQMVKDQPAALIHI
jgi:hypothetical protein